MTEYIEDLEAFDAYSAIEPDKCKFLIKWSGTFTVKVNGNYRKAKIVKSECPLLSCVRAYKGKKGQAIFVFEPAVNSPFRIHGYENWAIEIPESTIDNVFSNFDNHRKQVRDWSEGKRLEAEADKATFEQKVQEFEQRYADVEGVGTFG